MFDLLVRLLTKFWSIGPYGLNMEPITDNTLRRSISIVEMIWRLGIAAGHNQNPKPSETQRRLLDGERQSEREMQTVKALRRVTKPLQWVRSVSYGRSFSALPNYSAAADADIEDQVFLFFCFGSSLNVLDLIVFMWNSWTFYLYLIVNGNWFSGNVGNLLGSSLDILIYGNDQLNSGFGYLCTRAKIIRYYCLKCVFLVLSWRLSTSSFRFN